MKFSYSLLKKLVPAIKNPEDLKEKLTMGLFEVDLIQGDVFEVKVLPNRYSDSASHWGLAREISALYGKDFQELIIKPVKSGVQKQVPVLIEAKELCKRMSALYFENIKIAQSPKWLQNVLVSCGMRPINNLVDITNYVMLETGQPLHGFDYDKFADLRGHNADERGQKKLVVRWAKESEELELLDGTQIKLDCSIGVLSDGKYALDIAGIKGGKKAEITEKTQNIILTAGNFDGVSIYKTAKKTCVNTEASLRFSHNLSAELVELGISRAAELIVELCTGKAGVLVDVYNKKQSKQLIKFDITRLNKILGVNIKKETALAYLRQLGFKFKGDLVEVPRLRTDVAIFEDLVEEIARLYGYENIAAKPPQVYVHSSGFEDKIVLKDKIRKLLLSFGFDEVYNTSFWHSGSVEVQNPIAEDKKYLRPSLVPLLLKNIEDNFRFFNRVRIFEIGKIFNRDQKTKERTNIGLGLADKNKETFFELKGLIDELLKGLGLNDFLMCEKDKSESPFVETLIIETGQNIIGCLSRSYLENERETASIAELDFDKILELVEEEFEFKPLPKYPAVVRDISFLIDKTIRIGDLMQDIQLSDQKIIQDVDLIDEYADKKWLEQISVALRIIFRADTHTLTSDEINQEMKKITELLKEKFGAEVR